MGNLMKYSAIVAKVRAMDGNLFTDDDFMNLATMTDTQEFVDYLKASPGYKSVFEKVPDGLHRNEIEVLLKKSLYDDYSRLFIFGTGEQRKLMYPFELRYDVILIGNAIQRVAVGDDTDIQLKPVNGRLDYEALGSAQSYEDILSAVKGTAIYEPLFDARESSVFEQETALYKYYFTALFKWSKLLKSEKESFTEINGSMVDLTNIIWSYRARCFFAMNTESVLELQIPLGYKLSKKHRLLLAAASTSDEFLKCLEPTPYGKCFKDFSNIDGVYSQFMRRLYTKKCKQDPYSFATVLCYLYSKEFEIERLTLALECVRYKLSSREAMSYIMPEGTRRFKV